MAFLWSAHSFQFTNDIYLPTICVLIILINSEELVAFLWEAHSLQFISTIFAAKSLLDSF